MWRLTLRSARAHWRRFVLTTTAVVVGVAFVVGSFVLTDSLAGSLRGLLDDAAGRSDAIVRPAGGSRGGPGGVFGGSRAGVPVEVARAMAAVPGVAVADGVISGPAQLLDRRGAPGAFDFTLLSNWPTRPSAFGLTLSSGRPPTGPEDVVLDRGTAASRGLRVGDRVRLATLRGTFPAVVSGLAAQRGTGLVATAPVAAVTTERAAALVGVPGWYGVVNIRLVPGADRDAVLSRLREVAGPDAEVVRSDVLVARARADLEEELTTFVGLLLGFAAVTLVVSSFLIWNTFTVVVAQRTKELALLRAVGASRQQVAGSVVGEGLVVGAAASVLGLGAGVVLALGLRSLVLGAGPSLPEGELVVAARTVLVGVAVGVGVTAVSVLGPARRATAVPPVAALAAVDATPTRAGLGRPVLGSVALVAGAVVGGRALAGTHLPVEDRVRTVALGALLVFLGVAGVSRFLAGPVVGVLGAPLRRVGGPAGRLAARNAVRAPRRTASTASALMVGLALVATTLVVGESVRTAVREGLSRSVAADVVVDSGSIAPIGPDLVAALRARPGVATAEPMSIARADTTGVGRLTATSGDLPRLVRLVDPEVVRGRLPRGPGEVAVALRWAEDRDVGTGDRIVVRAGGELRPLRVVGEYRRRELYDDAVVAPGALDGLPGVEPVTRLVFVRTEPGVAPAAVARRLAPVVATVPNSTARTAERFVEDRTGTVDVVLVIVNVLLLFAVAVAGLGIANTLALSVVERTRELGLLRAVGMARRRVRAMVRAEGVLIAAMGGALGLALGVAFGAALVAVLPPETVELALPWGRLAALAALAVGLGVVAAALPARRAGRLDVLAAIAEE